MAPAQDEDVAALSNSLTPDQPAVSMSASSERSDSPNSEYTLDSDPCIDEAMGTLAGSVGARNEIYHKLSPIFTKIAVEDPRCPIADWRREESPRQFFANNDSEVCKVKILNLLSAARQALFWQWSKSSGDSSMLEMTEALAAMSRSGEIVAKSSSF